LADVTIQERFVEVYENLKEGDTKPQLGNKLNKPAMITLYGMNPKNKKLSISDYEL